MPPPGWARYGRDAAPRIVPAALTSTAVFDAGASRPTAESPVTGSTRTASPYGNTSVYPDPAITPAAFTAVPWKKFPTSTMPPAAVHRYPCMSNPLPGVTSAAPTTTPLSLMSFAFDSSPPRVPMSSSPCARSQWNAWFWEPVAVAALPTTSPAALIGTRDRGVPTDPSEVDHPVGRVPVEAVGRGHPEVHDADHRTGLADRDPRRRRAAQRAQVDHAATGSPAEHVELPGQQHGRGRPRR